MSAVVTMVYSQLRASSSTSWNDCNSLTDFVNRHASTVILLTLYCCLYFIHSHTQLIRQGAVCAEVQEMDLSLSAGWTIAILFWLVQRTFTLNVSCQSRMLPLDWSQGHVITTTPPRFLQNSTGFQCARQLCSRLWCWCGSVLKALLPAISLNPAFLLPLLQVVSITVQPSRPAYYKFPEPEPRSAVAGPSLWDSLSAALRRSEMTLHTFKRQLLKAYLFHI